MSELVLSKNGNVNISDDVIGVIASIATSEINGVKALSGSFSQEFMERIGKKNFQKGIEIEMNQGVVLVSLNLIVDYGMNILQVAREVQEAVKQAIETMTSLEVVAVHIHVVGIANEK